MFRLAPSGSLPLFQTVSLNIFFDIFADLDNVIPPGLYASAYKLPDRRSIAVVLHSTLPGRHIVALEIGGKTFEVELYNDASGTFLVRL